MQLELRALMILICLTVVGATHLCAVAGQPGGHSQQTTGETPLPDESRMDWWRDAKFGMFIHWGLYAIPAGEWDGKRIPGVGEWIMYSAQIPVDEYEPLRDRFNPVKFDAREWVRIAKDAGMKYIVITSKHHDGFALFNSKYTDWDIMSTPFKRDIMKELADACHDAGIRICWYHSIMDWHHPDYLPRRPWDQRPTDNADFGRYVKYLNNQVEELLTNYGDIGVMWFDGEWENTWTHEQGLALYNHVRSLQPDIIVNNRVDKGRQGMQGLTRDGAFAGDFGTPEQEIPATGLPGVDWESCMTMNDTWGYKSYDENWKSTTTLIHNLVDIASKGGNFLLNVGPTAEGEIPEASVERLREIGEWMRVNSDSIYGTHASPFKRIEWGRCTVDGNDPSRLYFHIFDWPGEDLVLRIPGLMNHVERAWLLERGESAPLRTHEDRAGVMVRMPRTEPDPHCTVLVLDVQGEPDVIELPVFQDAKSRVLTLRARDADVHGKTARYEHGGGKDNIGYWTNPDDFVSWDAEIVKPGRFHVRVQFACESGTAGSTFVVVIRNQDGSEGTRLQGTVTETGSWVDFMTADLGDVELGKGRYSIEVRPTSMSGQAVMNLRAVTLDPA